MRFGRKRMLRVKMKALPLQTLGSRNLSPWACNLHGSWVAAAMPRKKKKDGTGKSALKLSALVQGEDLYKLLEVSETSSVEVGDFVFFFSQGFAEFRQLGF